MNKMEKKKDGKEESPIPILILMAGLFIFSD